MSPARGLSRWSAIVVAVFCGLTPPLGAGTLRLTPIAVRGQLAPQGQVYILFGDIDIDSSGRVVFTASLTGGKNGIFRADRSGVETILLSGEPAPPAPGGAFFVIFEASGNSGGEVAFIASTVASPRQGVYLLSDDGLSLLAMAGEASPTAGGETFEAFTQVRMLESGDVYFSASIAGVEDRRGIFRASPAGVEPIIVPGDRFMGLREIFRTLQFDVNEAGDVATLAVVTDFSPAADPDAVTELLLLTGGRLHTLASSQLTLSGGLNRVRFFAITFDQVHVSADGITSFFASTTEHFLGGYFQNDSGTFFDNAKILAQGDGSPLSLEDRFAEFGAFGRNASGTLVFHATTLGRPRGGFFLKEQDVVQPVALVGEVRPDGLGFWHGFLRTKLNENDEFVFTDFRGLIQDAVFLGRVLPPPPEILSRIMAAITGSGLDVGTSHALRGKIRPVASALRRGDLPRAVRMAGKARDWIQRRNRRKPQHGLEVVNFLLDDLIFVLVGESPAIERESAP
ncbi:MAG: hypothetical protein ACE5HU_07055 [Acidobacteriota bacterium]